MAVLPGFPLRVSVRVAGQIAQEFEDPDASEASAPGIPTTNCYIESKAGVAFSIEIESTGKYEMPPCHDIVIFSTKIDGHVVRCTSQDVKSMSGRLPIRHVHNYMLSPTGTAGSYTQDQFMFASVSAVEDQAAARVAQEVKVLEHLGTISVSIEHAVSAGNYGWTYNYGGPSLQKLEFSEKSMKGKEISHATCFPKGQIVGPQSFMEIRDRIPVAEYQFKYRSREALRRELIIPRSPTPQLARPDDEIDGLSSEEIRRLARERFMELKTQTDNKKAVKRELDAADMQSAPRSLKMVKLENGAEAIDLTDD